MLAQDTGIGVREAIAAAVAFVKEVFHDENISNVGLEEVKYEDEEWWVTIGFSRPWNSARFDLSGLVQPAARHVLTRDFKLLRVDAQSGEVKSMEHRTFA